MIFVPAAESSKQRGVILLDMSMTTIQMSKSFGVHRVHTRYGAADTAGTVKIRPHEVDQEAVRNHVCSERIGPASRVCSIPFVNSH